MINESLESIARRVRQPEQRTLTQVAKSFLPDKSVMTSIAISYASGFVLGTIGRISGSEEIPGVVPLLDFLTGGWTPDALSDEKVGCYLSYGAGIATACTIANLYDCFRQ